jgi:hypothetical protein
MLCGHCGKQLPENIQYCQFCGKRVSETQPFFTSVDAQSGVAPPPFSKAPARMPVSGMVWCALCLAANLAVAIIGVITVSVPRTSSPEGIAAAIAAFAAVFGYIMLLFSNREGFFLVCLAAVAGFVTNLMTGNELNAAFGILNPVITWLLIKSAWQRIGQPFEKPRSRKTALVLASTPTGFLGFDRFYLGYGWLGLLKAVTFGGFLVWYALDIVSLARNTMRDGFDMPLYWQSDKPAQSPSTAGKARSLRIWGIVLIAIGLIAAISGVIQLFSTDSTTSIGSFIMGPVVFIGTGVFLLLKGLKKPVQK